MITQLTQGELFVCVGVVVLLAGCVCSVSGVRTLRGRSAKRSELRGYSLYAVCSRRALTSMSYSQQSVVCVGDAR